MIVAQPTQEAFAPIINVESFILWMAFVSLRAVIVLAVYFSLHRKGEIQGIGKGPTIEQPPKASSRTAPRPNHLTRRIRLLRRPVPEARLDPMRHGGDAEFFERPAQRLVGDLNGTGAAWRESPIWSSRATGR